MGWLVRVSADFGSCPADAAGVPPTGARWTCLQLDLHDLLLVYLNRRYGHLKSIRLCASLLVRNLYTSDLCFDPGEGHAPRPVLSLQPAPTPCVLASTPSFLPSSHPGFSARGRGGEHIPGTW